MNGNEWMNEWINEWMNEWNEIEMESVTRYTQSETIGDSSILFLSFIFPDSLNATGFIVLSISTISIVLSPTTRSWSRCLSLSIMPVSTVTTEQLNEWTDEQTDLSEHGMKGEKERDQIRNVSLPSALLFFPSFPATLPQLLPASASTSASLHPYP